MLSVDFFTRRITKKRKLYCYNTPCAFKFIDVKYKTQQMLPYNQWFYCNMDELFEKNRNKILDIRNILIFKIMLL